jgi:hypothetical protein
MSLSRSGAPRFGAREVNELLTAGFLLTFLATIKSSVAMTGTAAGAGAACAALRGRADFVSAFLDDLNVSDDADVSVTFRTPSARTGFFAGRADHF